MLLIVYVFNSIYLDLLWESGTEHHSLPDALGWHCILLHNASDLWFKAHIQHAVSLIQDQVAIEKHFRFKNKSIKKTTGINGYVILTCSSPDQFFLFPSCQPDVQAWLQAGDNLSPTP